MQKLSFFIAIAVLFVACGNGKKDLHDFYFPLKKLKDTPLVYEYKVSTPDTSFALYWYFQTLVQHDSVFFVGTAYDADLQQRQLFREEQVSNGMVLRDLYFFSAPTEGGGISSIRAKIEGGAAFPFEVKDSNSVFVNVIKYENPADSSVTTLTRNRRYLSETTFEFQGKKYDAILLETKEEEYNNRRDIGGIKSNTRQEEVYVKGIGWGSTRRFMGALGAVEMRLVNIYTMAELEKKMPKN